MNHKKMKVTGFSTIQQQLRVLAFSTLVGGLSIGLSACGGSGEPEQVVNLYSARHYDVDVALYESFSADTGIRVNVLEGKPDALIERIKNEGEQSPADVFVAVDAGRLWRAQEAGIFQPVDSRY